MDTAQPIPAKTPDGRPGSSLASNLKRMRTERGLSLAALAQRAGISKSTLFTIESDSGNPAIDTLWNLAQAMEVPIAEFFADPAVSAIDLLRFADAPSFSRSDHEQFAVRHLLSTRAASHCEVHWIDIDADAERLAASHSPGVIEHAIVLTGSVQIWVGGRAETLAAGDRLSFMADQPHRYRAPAAPTRLLSVLEYPFASVHGPIGTAPAQASERFNDTDREDLHAQ